ncbi:E3 ubiquitin-protein ligase Itchy homolog [Convolutriloba macropyga]|uniref:E3 ubiquitin-protein ligase Itchy homolog n=1 Tax=Convolutriloba macropyga TaxID=536237 RepID=UPI003F5221C0
MRKEAGELRKGLHVQFRSEEARDYGGVSREWFFLISQELLNPNFSLFEYANTQSYLLKINPSSHVNREHLKYFQFVGRVLAMALFHSRFLDCSFTVPFYKRILRRPLTLHDLESVDPEFYNSVLFIDEMDLRDLDDMYLTFVHTFERILRRPLTLHDLESVDPEFYNSVLFIDEMDLRDLDDMYLTFVHTFEDLGQVKEEELKPGGQDIDVNEGNKREYISLLIDARVNKGVKDQAKAFLKGFEEIVSPSWLKPFDERELEVMLCGVKLIDIEDWQHNTVYRTYSRTDPQIVWFWDFIREINNDERVRLLQFVTGTCRLPIGGFKDLMGTSGPKRFCIEKMGDDQNRLPKSHTCFNRLDLPAYESYDLLKEKLLFAVEETEGFAIE